MNNIIKKSLIIIIIISSFNGCVLDSRAITSPHYYNNHTLNTYRPQGNDPQKTILSGIINGGAIGGVVGAIAKSLTFVQGALIGAVAGGSYKAINLSNQRSTETMRHRPASYRQSQETYDQIQSQKHIIDKYKIIQRIRSNQHTILTQAKLQVPHYYNYQAGIGTLK